MSKITLNSVGDGSFLNASTAAATINANNGVIQAAFDNTLSLDGTTPNQLLAPIDMNSQQIINLPAPATNLSPLRLQDLTSFIGGGTVSTVPSGGTTGQGLTKHSNANYDMQWSNVDSSVGLSMPADFTVTNSPVTGSGTLTVTLANTATGTGGLVRQTSPALVTPNLGTPSAINLANATNMAVSSIGGLATGMASFLGTASSANLAGTLTDETGTGSAVFATSPTLVTPILGTPTSGNLVNCTGAQVAISTGVTGLAAGAATFLATPTSANLITLMTDETGTGANVFGTTPTITTPNIVGTIAVGNAAAGSVGEYLTSSIAQGSAVSLTTGVAANVTSLSLTAGDWDVWFMGQFLSAATTNITQLLISINTTSATTNSTTLGITGYASAGIVPGVLNCGAPMVQTRINVSSTTSVFAVSQAAFTVSTLGAWGTLSARRVR